MPVQLNDRSHEFKERMHRFLKRAKSETRAGFLHKLFGCDRCPKKAKAKVVVNVLRFAFSLATRHAEP